MSGHSLSGDPYKQPHSRHFNLIIERKSKVFKVAINLTLLLFCIVGCVSCEGSLLASGSADCTVKFGDVTTGIKVPRNEEK